MPKQTNFSAVAWAMCKTRPSKPPLNKLLLCCKYLISFCCAFCSLDHTSQTICTKRRFRSWRVRWRRHRIRPTSRASSNGDATLPMEPLLLELLLRRFWSLASLSATHRQMMLFRRCTLFWRSLDHSGSRRERPCRRKGGLLRPCRRKGDLRRPCRPKGGLLRPCRRKGDLRRPCRPKGGLRRKRSGTSTSNQTRLVLYSRFPPSPLT